MSLQSREWGGFPLDLTLTVLGLLTICCLPRTSDDFLIICSSSLLLPYILVTVYFLLLPTHFCHVTPKLTFYLFSLLCPVPPLRIPAFLAFYCNIGGEVLTGKVFLESCS